MPEQIMPGEKEMGELEVLTPQEGGKEFILEQKGTLGADLVKIKGDPAAFMAALYNYAGRGTERSQ